MTDEAIQIQIIEQQAVHSSETVLKTVLMAVLMAVLKVGIFKASDLQSADC